MKKTFETDKVVTVSLGHMIHDMYTAFLPQILPLLILKLSIPLSIVGLLDVIRKIPSLFNPVLGIIADKISLKYFIILAPSFTAISMSLLGLSTSLTMLIILLFISGISTALFHVPSPVAIKKFSGDRMGMGMSMFMFGGEIARSLGPLMITYAISLWTLEGSYVVMIPGLLSSGLLYLKLKDFPSSAAKATLKKDIPKESLKKYIPLFIVLTCFAIFRAAMKHALTLYLPIYLKNRGGSLWYAGIALSIIQFSGAIGTFFAGHISDIIGRKKTLFISTVAGAILMYVFVNTHAFTLPLLFFMGFFIFASGPVLLALVHDINTERPALLNSIFMTVNFFVLSFVALLIGIIAENMGIQYTFYLCSLSGFISIAFIFFIRK